MHTTPPPTAPPVDAPPRRSTSDRVVGGVSTATAGYLGVSRNVARLLFVLASAIGGLGVVVYVITWLFLPDDQGRVLIKGDGGASGEALWSSAASALAALIVTAWLTRNGPDLLVAVLVGAGVMVLTRRGGTAPVQPGGQPPADGPVMPPPYEPDAATTVMATPSPADAVDGRAADDVATDPHWTDATHDRADDVPFGVGASEDYTFVERRPESTAIMPFAGGMATVPSDRQSVPAPEQTGVLPTIEGDTAAFPRALPSRRTTMTAERPARPPKAPKPPRPPAFLGPLTVSAAVAVCGAMTLLLATGVWDLRLSDILITALVIVGLGLLVSTWYGRARGLILIGLLLVPSVLVSAVVDRVDLSGGIGDQRMAPISAGALAEQYRLGIGALTLDLRELDTATIDGPLRSSLSVGAGMARVYVPADWTVEIPVTVGVGEVELRERAAMTWEGEGAPPPDWTEWSESLAAYDVVDVPVDAPQPADVDGNVSTIRSTGAEGAPVLELDVDVSVGYVEVFRVES